MGDQDGTFREALRHGLSRRDFLRRGAATAGAVAAGGLLASADRLLAQDSSAATASPSEPAPTPAPPAPAAATQPPPAPAEIKKSRVVVITHPEALIEGYVASRLALERMIDRAVREFTGADSAKKAWEQVAVAGQRVSMKITRAGGDSLRTHDEIPACIARRLVDHAGLDPKRIRAWDRPDLTPEELELSDPYVLPTRKKETRLRAALVKNVAAIVNLPVLKMHSGTGASIALKNHFGSINNPSAFHGWETGDMARSIAELSNLEPIRTRTRLVVVDATRPLYQGGPGDKPEFRWSFNGLIVGVDPVAVESVGLDILEKKREEVRREPWPVTDGRKVVEWAQKIGLGNADKDRIDLVRVDLE